MNAAHPLQTWRESKRLSREQLADQLGCTRQAISRYEEGRMPRQPFLDQIVVITDGAVTANDWLGSEASHVASACDQ